MALTIQVWASNSRTCSGNTSRGLLCNDCFWDTYLGWAYAPASPTLRCGPMSRDLARKMWVDVLFRAVQHLRSFHQRMLHLSSSQTPSCCPAQQEDAMVGSVLRTLESLSHHAIQGGTVKTAGVEPDNSAWNPESSRLSPKPITFPSLSIWV